MLCWEAWPCCFLICSGLFRHTAGICRALFLVLGYFLCSILWCPKIYSSLFLNFGEESGVIYDEPEAQLGAEEEGTGGSEAVRKRARFGALAWSFAVVTNFCQAEGLSPEKILPNCHHVSVIAVWHCTVREGSTKHNGAKICSTRGASLLSVLQSNPLLLKNGCPRQDP